MLLRDLLQAPRRQQVLLVSLLVLLMVAVSVLSMRNKSLTYDEPGHLIYGHQVLHGRTDRLDDSKMPVSALNAVPLRVAERVEPGFTHYLLSQPNTARAVTVLFTAVLAVVVFSWSARAFGFRGGLISLFLMISSPNLLAHGRLVTTDLYSALFTVVTLFTFWLLILKPSWWRALSCGFILGCSLLAKFSSILLFPILGLVLVVRYGTGVAKRVRQREWPGLQKRFARGSGLAACVLVVALVVLNAGYLSNGVGSSLASYEFSSPSMKTLQEVLGPVAQAPLPLPRPYVEGLDLVKHNEETGEARGPAYLFGQTRKEPFSWYYAAVFLLKVPIATQVLLVLALGFGVRRLGFDSVELFLLVPLLVFFMYFNFFCRAQFGIRLALMMLPIVHVLCGSLATTTRSSSKMRWIVGVLVAFQTLSTLSYYPHFLSYFNELHLDRTTNYKLLADSNLDWGQNEHYARRYLEAHPEVVKNPEEPVSGRVLVSANLLVGTVFPDRYRWYAWLLNNLEPVDHVAYSYLVFSISEQDLVEITLYASSIDPAGGG
jgi:4-amino-4-deoxy-L-arabinose transferase-like glycosyltransferase